MSTDPHGHASNGAPRNADVAFEARDVTTSTIYWYLIVLALAVAACFGVCVFILKYTDSFVASQDEPVPASRIEHPKAMDMLPPEPRLQGVPGHDSDPQTDLREKVASDTRENERYGWIDQPGGIAQIPVKDAMKIIAEKGLPAVSAPTAEKKK